MDSGLTAMCVAGGMRSFPYPKVRQSILELKNKLSATLFLVMHETYSPGVEKYVQVPFKANRTALQAALDLLEPVHVEIHNASTCQNFRTVEVETHCCDDEWMQNYLQFGWIWHCLNVVKQYEEDHKVKFEFFVRVRPDVMYFALENLPSKEDLRENGITLAQKLSRAEPADWIFIVTRSSLEWFLQAMAEVQDHCNLKHAACRKSSEEASCKEKDMAFQSPEYSSWYRGVLGRVFLRGEKRWPYEAVNLQPVIVRSSGMADCFRILWDRSTRLKCLEFTAKGWDKVRRLGGGP